MSVVPHAEYARLKTRLYRRIDILQRRAERAERALADLVEIHHATISNSKLHAPERQDWRECPCASCRSAATVLAGVDHVRHASVDQRHDDQPPAPHNQADAGIRSPSTGTRSNTGGTTC